MANASAMKKELIIRLYAERLGDLFSLMLRTFIKHQDKPKLIRLNPDEPPVSIDPRFWNADMDVSVKVGLGTGTKDQQMQALMLIMREQKEALAAGSSIVDEEKLYNAQARLVELAGLSNAELYWNDPAKREEQQQMIPAEALQQAQAQAFEEGAQQGAQQATDEMQQMKMRVDLTKQASEERMQKRDIALAAATGSGI